MSNQVDWQKYQWKDTDSLEEKQRKASLVMSALDEDIKKMEPLPWESGVQSEDLPVLSDPRIHLYKGSEIDDRYDEIKTLYGNGMTTGFDALDELFTFLPEHLYLLSAETHIGKCLGKGTRVMMSDGKIKNVEDIVSGDKLMGPDNKPRKVLSTTTGKDNLFRIDQNFGSSYVVNSKHVLSLKCSTLSRKQKMFKKYEANKIINIPLDEYLTRSKNFRKFVRGWHVPVDFKEKKLGIDPYFLGLWLGDGDSKSVRITSGDQEIINWLEVYAREIGMKLHRHISGDKCGTFSVVKNKGEKGNLQSRLRKLNLLGNKHIPESYLINSRKNRLELLAGLIDTDGWIGKSKWKEKPSQSYQISMVNPLLVNDIYRLATSLGFDVSMNQKISKMKRKDGSVYMIDSFRITITGEVSEIPVKIERKKITVKRIKTSGFSKIYPVPLGYGDYYGFTLEGDGLFLLGDCTVTHNTTFALNMCGKASTLGHSVLFASLEQGIFIAPRIKTILGGPIPETFSLLDTTQLVNIDELAGFIKTMEIKPALLCIDHIHFIKKKGNNPNIDIEEMVVDMKNMAKDLRIPILLIAHLRKLSDTKPPTPNDIKDSVALSQVPDVTMILHREKRDMDDETDHSNDLLKPNGKLYIYKNRVTGKTGTLNFSLLPTGEFVFDFG